jgi:hypothetical protein
MMLTAAVAALQADQLPGGIDGIYSLLSCKNGRPLYRRKESPPGEDRVLWYSHQYGDWDVAKGTEPNEVSQRCWGMPGGRAELLRWSAGAAAAVLPPVVHRPHSSTQRPGCLTSCSAAVIRVLMAAHVAMPLHRVPPALIVCSLGSLADARGCCWSQVEILMYGGEVEHASVPLYVSSWHLGADLNSNSNMDEDDYMPIAVTVS